MIDLDHSVRPWSGEVFWNEDWNRDIDFTDAFQTSCVWYFRQVIDEIGKERMQQALETLQYGNCDISDWEGRLNTNNDNRALTGFWIESSLQISPKEQVQVLERIFGQNAAYSKQAQDALKQVMCVSTHQVQGIEIYGKTGMGKADGVTVDAWFTGFCRCRTGPGVLLRLPGSDARQERIEYKGQGDCARDFGRIFRIITIDAAGSRAVCQPTSQWLDRKKRALQPIFGRPQGALLHR